MYHRDWGQRPAESTVRALRVQSGTVRVRGEEVRCWNERAKSRFRLVHARAVRKTMHTSAVVAQPAMWLSVVASVRDSHELSNGVLKP
jgi:hypothetical protein